MIDLDKDSLVTWMRQMGVLEFSSEGTTIKLDPAWRMTPQPEPVVAVARPARRRACACGHPDHQHSPLGCLYGCGSICEARVVEKEEQQ